MRAHLLVGLGAWTGCAFEHGRVATRGDAALIDVIADTPSAIDAAPDAIGCPSGTGTVPDIRVEAENFTASTMVGAHAWTMRTDQPCFTGTGFLELLPDDGSLQCAAPQVDIVTCGPRAEFEVMVPADGDYYFFARMMSLDGNEDSIYWGIDFTVVGNQINQDENPIPIWKWEIGALTLPVTAGAHTVKIWMREDGARVDAIALSRSAALPP